MMAGMVHNPTEPNVPGCTFIDSAALEYDGPLERPHRVERAVESAVKMWLECRTGHGCSVGAMY